jgi:hypothetical protein
MPWSRRYGAISPLPNTPSWRGAQLKHRDNFTLPYLYLITTVKVCILSYFKQDPKIFIFRLKIPRSALTLEYEISRTDEDKD